VARRLQELAVPFIFVSGYASPNVLSPDLQEHTRLNKPVNERELGDTLVRTLAGRGRSGGTLGG
jgi:two-component SAPR family response regulator